MTTYTDWTSGEPIEKEWAMTGPTDPALRALERLDGIIEHARSWSAGDGMLDDLLFVRAALAAAEAAPLDVRETTLREAAERVRALAADTDDDGERERREFGWYGAIAAAGRAILSETDRSPDTETAGEAG